VCRVVDAGSMLFGLNCVLDCFRLTIEIGNLAFGLGDVDQWRTSLALVRIGLLYGNPLFDVLKMGLTTITGLPPCPTCLAPYPRPRC
jgi:hypothetical protein